MILIVGILIFILLIGVFLIAAYSGNRKLSTDQIKYFKSHLKKIQSKSSEKEKIIDFDKLYHKILQEIGHKGSFGQILKSKPREIKDLQKIWELHKLRNKLVHDLKDHNESYLKKEVAEYEQELKNLFKIIT